MKIVPRVSLFATGSALIGYQYLKRQPLQQEDFNASEQMTTFVKTLQHQMVAALSKFETKEFLRDNWQRQEGGYGTSAVVQNGTFFEKAGVNISIIKSKATPNLIQKMSSLNIKINENSNYDFFVAGISMVIHPINPHCPTMHANYRYFELLEDGKVLSSWYGGGTDLTPNILYKEDAVHFHSVIKKVCDKHDLNYYPEFKKWCDQYFYNPHRGESRGIGGIFFDDLMVKNTKNAEKTFDFIRGCGNALVDQVKITDLVYSDT
jgi:coproporphyrinogen III oxidase